MTGILAGIAEALASPLSAAELLGLFGHFMLLSMLSIGGAIATLPDMHRYAVSDQNWLSAEQFAASVAIAQAAPGPNVLFVVAIGWSIAGPLGVLVTMTGILLPSTVLSLAAHRWGNARRESPAIRAFTSGMAPLTLGLLLATGWLLAIPSSGRWQDMALVAFTILMLLKTRISPVWLIAVGGGVGAWLGVAN